MTFGSSLKYRIGSREVSSEEFLAHQRRRILDSIPAQVEAVFAELRCEEHGEVPTVEVADRPVAAGTLPLDIRACCAAQRAMALVRLEEITARATAGAGPGDTFTA